MYHTVLLITCCLQVLGDKAFEKLGKWFISLHFSDQFAGSYKKALMFKFVLPDANNMSEMTRLVALIPYYIDLVGRYKLSSHVRPPLCFVHYHFLIIYCLIV
jgi:hypothetical protein